jgi:RimJ/RimL family protein N-acetyltransferase
MADNPWIGDDAGLLRAAGHVALACSAPGLAHTALRALDELGRALPSDLAALARSLEQLGRLPDALAACQRALSRGPGDEALAAQQRLTQRLEAMSVPWRVPHGHPGSPLLLDPLHADHAPMLAWQLRDPSVASMTALAPLEPGDDGRGWIRTRLADGTAVFALMHRQLGFVGYLDLRVWDTTAFLCYWIGPDFQGLGLCAPAIALARELAFANGVRLLVSSAYDDNERSLRALRRSGFRVLPVRAQAPDHDRTFVMLPAAPMAEQEALERLIDFCDKTGSGLRFGTGIGTAAPDAAGRT